MQKRFGCQVYLRSHNDLIGALCHISHTDIFATVMKLHCDLKKQTLSVSHSVHFLHAVKNRQGKVGSTLNMILSSRITFGNVSGCHQNIIFKIMCALNKILLFPEIIGNAIKKNVRSLQMRCATIPQNLFITARSQEKSEWIVPYIF